METGVRLWWYVPLGMTISLPLLRSQCRSTCMSTTLLFAYTNVCSYMPASKKNTCIICLQKIPVVLLLTMYTGASTGALSVTKPGTKNVRFSINFHSNSQKFPCTMMACCSTHKITNILSIEQWMILEA